MKVGTADVMLLVGLAGLTMAVGRVNLAAGVMVGSVFTLAWLRSIGKSGGIARRGLSAAIANFLGSIAVSSLIMMTSTVMGIATAALLIGRESDLFLGLCASALASMPVTSFLVRKFW